MSSQADLEALTLAGIAHRCRQETEHFFQDRAHDPRYCFELFRRAILHRNQRAWAQLYAQYQPLVMGWISRHSAFPESGEEVEFFVNRAFEKMWAALTPAKFARFPDLKSLLRYLQMCVHSAILDQVRKAGQPVEYIEAGRLPAGDGAPAPSFRSQALSRVQRREFWDEICVRLRNEKERRVMYCSYVLGLKPREFDTQFGDTFRDVNEIYRIKENVLARLRRDRELKKSLGLDA